MNSSTTSRRSFLKTTIATTASGWTLSAAAQPAAANASSLEMATFRFDVTPPLGHSCCGGWIKPVEVVDDALEAVGVVLLGAGKPIVLCTVDWTGLLNEAHIEWRTALAEAAGTTPDRVAVHCVHQHNAPFACVEAERLVLAEGDLPHIVELDFFRKCLSAGRQAVRGALQRTSKVTHLATGQGRVEKVASNRRVARHPDGRIRASRSSSCKDAELRALPEGKIDPWMKTIAFFNGDRKLAALHYYATHPMSYYADGRATSDFAGLARKRRQADEPDCLHVYFTGCAGDVAAGKYNDGSKEMRPVLTKRVYDGIVRSEKELQPKPIGEVGWRTADLLPPPRNSLSAAAIQRSISNKQGSVVSRNRPSYALSWLRRLEKKTPIVLSALHIDGVRLLHLPAECFVEYQLRAQQVKPDLFTAVAAYGDGGPWYIPTKDEYPAGGYEVSVSYCDPSVDGLLTAAMKELL